MSEFYTCPKCGDVVPLEAAEIHEEGCIGEDSNESEIRNKPKL